MLGIQIKGPNFSAALKHIASVEQQGSQIHISVWDNTNMSAVTSALSRLDYSFSATKNRITITVPPMTVEQEQQIVAQLRELLEAAKVSVRNERKKQRDAVDTKSKDDRDKVLRTIDKLADAAVAELDAIFTTKVEKLTGKQPAKRK